MGLQQKVKIDQIISMKYGGFKDKVAKKSIIVIKKKEVQKVKAARAAKKDA
jgi:hypothetical protein